MVVRESGGWGRLLFVGLLSALAGAFLALLVLFVVNNGTLDYRATAIREAKRETYGLGVQIGDLNDRLNELDGRLGALRDLSARLDGTQADVQALDESLATAQAELATLTGSLDEVRQEYTNLREDVDGLAGTVSAQGAQLDEVNAQLAGLDEQLQALDEAAARFDGFLEGLRSLLNESLGPVTPTPWLTPTPKPAVVAVQRYTNASPEDDRHPGHDPHANPNALTTRQKPCTDDLCRAFCYLNRCRAGTILARSCLPLRQPPGCPVLDHR